MLFTRKRVLEPEHHGWIINQFGWETTAAATLITAGLTYLKNRRRTMVLTSRGYQSGATVLVDYGPAGLVLGRPADLPAGSATTFRVHFKDHANLTCCFDVQVVYSKEDLLFTSVPRQLMRLQRRAHYRVETPEDSRASLICHGELNANFAIKDLSIGGMRCCGSKKMAEGTPLTEISLTLPSCSGDSQNIEIIIPQGKVRRFFIDKEMTKLPCHGIAFRYGKKEETALLRYIRQREIELARLAAER